MPYTFGAVPLDPRLPLAQFFPNEHYYNSYALGICSLLVMAGILLIATSWKAFDHWIDQDTMPSVAKRMFWRRVGLIFVCCFGLAASLWLLRGPIGSQVMPMGDPTVSGP